MFDVIKTQVESLEKHERTMIAMFEVTDDIKYLDRALADKLKAESLNRGGFVRPLGASLDKAA